MLRSMHSGWYNAKRMNIWIIGAFPIYMLEKPKYAHVCCLNHFVLFLSESIEKISSVESQKGTFAIQRCSIENHGHRHCTVILPFWFSMEHLWNIDSALLALKWIYILPHTAHTAISMLTFLMWRAQITNSKQTRTRSLTKQDLSSKYI